MESAPGPEFSRGGAVTGRLIHDFEHEVVHPDDPGAREQHTECQTDCPWRHVHDDRYVLPLVGPGEPAIQHVVECADGRAVASKPQSNAVATHLRRPDPSGIADSVATVRVSEELLDNRAKHAVLHLLAERADVSARVS
jgi:hypothetical protein